MRFQFDQNAARAEKLKTIQGLLKGDPSPENLVLSCLTHHFSLTMFMDNNAGGDRLLIASIKDAAIGAKAKERQVAIAVYPSSEWRSWGRFQALDTTAHDFADQEGAIPNDEWFEKRDERLQIKQDPREGVMVAPPASMKELILSYLLEGRGIANISKEIVEIKSGCPFAAVLELQNMPKDEKHLFTETLAIVLDKLERLVAKRMSSKEKKKGDDSLFQSA